MAKRTNSVSPAAAEGRAVGAAPAASDAPKRNQIPENPFYLSRSMEVNWRWSNNFAAHIPVIGPNYGISALQIDSIVANANVLDITMQYITEINTWRGLWNTTRDQLFSPKPATPGLPVPFPLPRKFPTLPEPLPAWILATHVEVAELLLNNPALSQIDRETLRLVRAEGKPVAPETKKRQKAGEFNYPVVKYTVEMGFVVIKATRGSKERRKQNVLIQVSKDNSGKFENVVFMTGDEYKHKIVLPVGEKSASWVYRAIYVENGVEMSDWSPETPVAVVPMAEI